MKRRILSVLMVVMMLVGMLPQTAFAAARDENKDQVRVIVENTTYSQADGAAWDGTLVDTWIDIDETSSMMSCVVDALDEKGYTQTGAESGFISEVNGLGIGAPDMSSGWMGSLNDWFTNEGFEAFTVESGKLEAGDEIRIMFSAYGYGEDLGGTWANNDKTVKALEFSEGSLDKAFSANEHEYTLTLPEGTTGVEVTPTATNKNFQVRTSVAGTEYKRTETVPVENGTVITVTCGDPAWPSMNAGEYGTGAENVPAEVYTINVAIEETIKGTEVNVENNVIDITDYKFASFSSYYSTATALTISGGDVVVASQDGTDIYVVLSSDTAQDGQITADFNCATNKFTVTQNVKTVTLTGGKADLSVTLDGKYNGSMSMGKASYNLHFSCEKPPTTVPECLQTAETIDVKAGLKEALKLKDYFRNAKDYYQVVDGELVKLDGNVYSFFSVAGGEHKIVFAAGNDIGLCEDYLEVTFNVDAIESGIWLCEESSNGALNSVVFSDTDGNAIEGLEGYYDAAKHEINVLLPKDYPVNGTVKTVYSLNQNSSGLPFITTKTGTSGTTSGKAVNNKFTEKTVTLSNGAATFTFYYYNTTPTNRDNVYTTFTVKYKVKNDIPTLAEGQAAEISETITAGETYSVDLGSVFADADNDELTYKVSVNGESATADANYEFVTNTAGEYTLVFTANDGKDTSEDTFTVNLTVKNVDQKAKMTVNVPEGLTPEFYATNGFEDGIDNPGDKLEATALETADGMTSYEVSFPLNAEYISVRTDEWGGMAFAAEADKTVSLRQVMIQAEDLNEKSVESSFAVTYGEYKAVGNSGQYLLVTGTEYKYSVNPADSATYESASMTGALEEGASEFEVVLTLKYKNPKTITAPTSAKVQLYKYSQYYSQPELAAKAAVDNKDGTTTWYFTPASNDQLNYRVSMDGKITKAGYLAYNDNNISVTYSEDDATPDTTVSTGGAAAVGDSSTLLNVNGQNNLVLSEGGTYKLKGYRTWEIIRNQTNNHIIAPDFHFNVISGQDVVELSSVKSKSNSGSDEFSDWRNVKALKNGVAIIEVSYDAVQIAGGDYAGIYGATDSARTGLVVVQVGDHDSSVKFGIDSFASKGSVTYSAGNARDWDAEFDTLYFIGEYGELKLSPSASGDITEVAVSNDKGDSWTALEAEEGVYTAKIASGNNIIRVTTEAGTAYQVVRGDKVTSVLQEKEGDGDGIIEAGETIRVMFNGLHTPIPKMAGNYNPGYAGNTDGYSQVHIKYTVNNEVISGPGTQYSFGVAANYVDIAIPEDYEGDIVSLEDGYIGVGVIGLTSFVDGGDSHRNIPDAGCGTRGSQTSYHTRSIMPEVDIVIGGTVSGNMPPKVKDDAVTADSIEMGQKYALNPETLFEDADRDELTFTVSVNGGEATVVAADYRFEPSAEGEYELTFTASDEELSVSHSITLTVTAAAQGGDDELVFDISGSDIKGYVTVSFEDKGVRKDEEYGQKFPVALGTIVEETKVPYAEGDTIADVTLRLLDAKKMGYEYSGTTKNGFYLSAIKNFVVDKVPYDRMAEFDAGQGSGWMITHNDVFINQGASEFTVKDGDVVEWKYTCQLGADIGDPFHSKEVQNVIELIKAIGEVTLESESEITAARTAYDALDENVKGSVTNYADLEAAEKAFEALKQEAAKDEAAAAAVEKLINDIGEVTLDSEKAIVLARAAYAELTDAQKDLVDNYENLQNAEKLLEQLKQEAKENEEKAAVVENLIEAIGNVTLESESAITAARTAYDNLTDAQKELVGNYGTLQTAEIVLKQLTDAHEADKQAAGLVESLIDSIGEVTLNNTDISMARMAYNMLTDAQKELVGNYDTLTAAEEMLDLLIAKEVAKTEIAVYKNAADYREAQQEELAAVIAEANAAIDAAADKDAVEAAVAAAKTAMDAIKTAVDLDAEEAEADAVAAEAVEALIEAIGDITLDSEEAIAEARAAYDALTENQAALVTNYNTLTAAEEMLEQLKLETEDPDQPVDPDMEYVFKAVISEELVPTKELAEAGFDTPEKIAAALTEATSEWMSGDDVTETKTELFNVTLMVSKDDGETWTEATAEDIPEDGVSVEILFEDIPGMDFAEVHNAYDDLDVFIMYASTTHDTAAGSIAITSRDFGDGDEFDRINLYMPCAGPIAFAWCSYEETEDIDISEVTVEPIPDQIYTGEEIYPEVVVKYDGKVLEHGWDYEEIITDNVDVGTATVTIYGMNDFCGEKEVTFNIVKEKPADPDQPVEPEKPSVPDIFAETNNVRFAGASRYSTSAVISQQIIPDNAAKAIVLVNGQDFADALAAGALAEEVDAPILMVNGKKGTIDAAVTAEINRIDGDHNAKVYIVGGPNAISTKVDATLAKMGYGTANIERVYGATRYETAIKVAEKVEAKTAFVVYGKNFPDALGGGSAAMQNDGVVLFTGKDKLDSSTKAYIEKAKFERVVILGGTAAVSSNVEKQLKGICGNVSRISGANRYATSAAVAKSYFPKADTIVVATGLNYADALSGGPLASHLDAPIVLVDAKNNKVSPELKAYIESAGVKNISVLGGESAISKNLYDQLKALVK